MAYSGAQVTRQGLSGTPRGLYGSFAGKAEVTPAPPNAVVVDSGTPRVPILPLLPARMDPELRRSLVDILQIHANQINYATGYDVISVATSQSIAHDLVLVDSTATAAVTLTLPPVISWRDRTMRIKMVSGTGSVKVVAQAGELIDGSATASLSTTYDKLQIVSSGGDWWKV